MLHYMFVEYAVKTFCLSFAFVLKCLCFAVRLINKLSKAAGLPPTTFNAKASSSFVAMSNIENFNNAAKAYGVPTTALFQTPDLYEGRKGPLLNVINCLNQLGFVVCIYLHVPAFQS